MCVVLCAKLHCDTLCVCVFVVVQSLWREGSLRTLGSGVRTTPCVRPLLPTVSRMDWSWLAFCCHSNRMGLSYFPHEAWIETSSSKQTVRNTTTPVMYKYTMYWCVVCGVMHKVCGKPCVCGVMHSCMYRVCMCLVWCPHYLAIHCVLQCCRARCHLATLCVAVS